MGWSLAIVLIIFLSSNRISGCDLMIVLLITTFFTGGTLLNEASWVGIDLSLIFFNNLEENDCEDF